MDGQIFPDKSITLKKADVGTSSLLANFLQSSFADAYKEVHTMENIRAYCSQHYSVQKQQKVIEDPLYDVFFADKLGENVGVIVVHHHECPLRPDLRSSELKQLYLLASEYGTGLGKLLIERSFELAREKGNSWMWLCVPDLNHRAQRFYQKNHFDRIGAGPVLAVGTERLNSSIMLRRLSF